MICTQGRLQRIRPHLPVLGIRRTDVNTRSLISPQPKRWLVYILHRFRIDQKPPQLPPCRRSPPRHPVHSLTATRSNRTQRSSIGTARTPTATAAAAAAAATTADADSTFAKIRSVSVAAAQQRSQYNSLRLVFVVGPTILLEKLRCFRDRDVGVAAATPRHAHRAEVPGGAGEAREALAGELHGVPEVGEGA